MAAKNTIDTSPLRAYGKAFRGSAAADAMYRAWGARYLGFVRRRFIRLSRGGAEWPRLAPSTRKRKPARPAGSPVLVVTGQLRDSLSVGSPGNHFRIIPRGVEVGFADRRFAGSATTIRDIAVFHDEGGKGGNPPRRPILVEPDAQTVKGFEQDVKDAAERIGREAERKL